MATQSRNDHALPMLTALLCGVLAVLALQVVLNAKGLRIVDLWGSVIAGNPLTLRMAMVWWVIAGTALVAGAAIARVLVLFPPPWRRYRSLRWIIGTAIVFGLAHLAHGANVPEGVSAGIFLVASGLAIVIGGAMALIGAVFALRT